MTDYAGNSKRDKEPKNNPKPEKVVEKVVTGDVILRKPGPAARFKTIFFGGDMRTAGQYVVGEVLIPALRNLAVEIINKGTDRIVYGESGRRRPPTNSYAPRVQYNNPLYSRPYSTPSPAIQWRQQENRNLDRIIVSSKLEADTVIERMIDIWDSYQVVSVADLYELLGLPSAHIDHKWGWNNLPGIESRQTREGYLISLPPVEEIS